MGDEAGDLGVVSGLLRCSSRRAGWSILGLKVMGIETVAVRRES